MKTTALCSKITDQIFYVRGVLSSNAFHSVKMLIKKHGITQLDTRDLKDGLKFILQAPTPKVKKFLEEVGKIVNE